MRGKSKKGQQREEKVWIRVKGVGKEPNVEKNIKRKGKVCFLVEGKKIDFLDGGK